MAFTKYVTQFKDKDDNVYGVMDEECRLSKADIISVSDTTAEPVKTFPDGADGMPMGMVVGVEPVQDLHGQENPWPAGGGKNLVDININTSVNSGSITFETPISETVTISAKKNNVTISEAVWIIDVLMQDYTHYYIGDTGYINPFPQTINATAENPIVKITWRNYGITSGSYDIQLEKGSTATSWVPYENICPISGWDSANVQIEQGKNFLPVTKKVYSDSNITLTLQDNGYFHVYHTRNVFDRIVFGKVLLKKGQKIKLTKIGAASSNNLFISVGRTIGTSEYNNSWMNITGALTIEETGEYYIWTNVYGSYDIDVGIGIFFSDSISDINSFTGPIINGNALYSFPFPEAAGTVYGGTLTVNADGTGTLVVDRAIVDLGDLTWNVPGDTNIFYSTGLPDHKTTAPICSQYKGVSEASSNINAYNKGNATTCFLSSGNMRLYVRDDSYSSASDFKTAMSGVKLVYELAAPQTYTLTDLDLVETLKGMNNLWADTGDIKAVNYPADTKLYIDGKIAALQALILENISNS